MTTEMIIGQSSIGTDESVATRKCATTTRSTRYDKIHARQDIAATCSKWRELYRSVDEIEIDLRL